ncbi:MAG: hypothetical protein J7L63_05175 [Thermoplasmata archaeon]|nr:hypothetical protein [Thermoplasmata archaeon]
MADEYPQAAFVVSLIGGIFILLNGLLISSVGGIIVIHHPGAGMALVAVGLVLGIVVLIGTMMMRDPQKVKVGSILVLVFSIFSLPIGGGFIIGFLLGLIGGILGLTWKPPRQTVIIPPPPTI